MRRIPWELLDDTGDGGRQHPWAVRVKLLRKLRTEDFRERVTDADAEAHVLVIGEPACPDGYPRLPGAREEAAEVFRRLSAADALGSSHVTKLLSDHPHEPGPDARTVINTLFERDWRVVHVAGHGAPPTGNGKAGVVRKRRSPTTRSRSRRWR